MNLIFITLWAFGKFYCFYSTVSFRNIPVEELRFIGGEKLGEPCFCSFSLAVFV